jgi:hypothetical protein
VLASTSSTILDYIQTLRWPLIVLLLISLLLWKRVEVADVVEKIWPRLKRFGPVELYEQQQATPATSPQQVLDEQEEKNPELLEEYEQLIAMYEIETEDSRKEIAELRERLALKTIEADFERLYRQIFGSQIFALRALNISPPNAPRDTLEPYFQSVQKSLLPQMTFDQWMEFLLRTGLAASDINRQMFNLTPKGRGFLDYIDRLGYPLKPL